MRLPAGLRPAVFPTSRLGRGAAALAVPVAAAVLLSGGPATATAATAAAPASPRMQVPAVRVDACTPANLSGCNGTDAPDDPSLLRYCGPDGACAPVARPSTPRRGAHRAAGVTARTTAG